MIADRFILLDPITTGIKYAKILREKGCDLIIALTHMLNQSDLKLASKIDSIDLFLGGHEHCYLIHKNKNTLAVKSGSNFESFNEFEI